MSIAMQQISSELSDLYKELPKHSHISTKSFQIEVENTIFDISVIMQKIRNREEEKEMPIRKKLYMHKVSIFIILPEKDRVWSIAYKHFEYNFKVNIRKILDVRFDSIKMSLVLPKKDFK
jgi:hypothetical protein